MYFHCWVTFTGIFDVFVLLRRMTLWSWPLTFWPWECIIYSASHARPTFDYPTTIGYWVTITEYFITFPSSQTVTAHAPCHVTYHRGDYAHFWNPWPQFSYSLCHFHGAKTKIKPCYRRKIAFSHYEGYKLQSLPRMRSITWPVHRRSPKTTRNNFLTPNCLFTIQLLWGYDDDLG